MDERLWAGWRMKYIVSAKSGGCLFCEKSREKPGARNLVLLVTPRSLVMLNAFPYNCGHLMIAPRRHVSSFSRLTEDESLELMRLLSLCERLLKQVYRAEGFNVGLNLGKCAGAGVLGHLHVHVVPRWAGDTNFMSTVSSTKVLPESLGDSYRRLRVGLVTMGSAPGRKKTAGAKRHGRRTGRGTDRGTRRTANGSKRKRVR
jgi:ATP adenylyltransferase